jgi:hypothetical protein
MSPIYRILIVLGASLILAGIVAELVGAKTESSRAGVIPVYGQPGAAISVYSLTTKGLAEITISNARSAYYLTLKGDPMMVLRQLTTLNISLENLDLVHDYRAGIVYGETLLSTSPAVIATLPLISSVVPVKEVKGGESGFSISVELSPGYGVVVIVVPASEQGLVEYNVKFKVEGYRRTPLTTVTVLGVIMSLSGLILSWRGFK